MSAQDKFDDKNPQFRPIDFSGLDLPDFGNMDMSAFGLPEMEGVDINELTKQLAGRMGRMARENGLSYEDLAYGYDPALMGAHPTSEEEMGRYLFNPLSQGLTRQRLAALAMSALPSLQNGFYLDSLALGAGEEEAKDILSADFGITNRESAVLLLDFLTETGDREDFDRVKELAVTGETTGDEERDIYIENLNRASSLLVSEGFLITAKSLAQTDISGWDAGRAAFIARLATQAGFIDEGAAWGYINKGYDLCKERYNSWDDFATGYLTGFAMENGKDEMLTALIYLAEDMLSDPESPWKKTKF